MSKRRRVLITALLLIFLPLLESMGTGTLWGLNYESAKTMDSMSDVIRVLKLLSVAKAYHYVYLKCPLSLNRYELKSLGKTGWLGGVSIQRNDDELIVR